MYIRHLSLADFRSWPLAELPLGPGPVALVGRNGAGKTNLVEAIGYLATLGSHRVATDAPLIRREAERALVRAAVVSAGRELLVEVEIGAGRANKARINRSAQRRPKDLLGIIRTVLFAPEDLAIVRGDPSDRRHFLDELLVMRAPRLAGVKSDYDRILRQRATLLKSAGGARRSGSGLATLDVWDEHLAETGSGLLAARLELVDALRPHLIAAYAAIAPESSRADIRYRSDLLPAPNTSAFQINEPDSAREFETGTFLGGTSAGKGGAGGVGDGEQGVSGVGNGPWTARDLKDLMLAAMAELRDKELDRGVCLVGPHRDDLTIELHGGPAKGYASHGESWSLALALRIASFELLREDGVDPILILDDVFAELDPGRRQTLAAVVREAEQAIITAADPGDVPTELGATIIHIADGQIQP